MRYQTALGTDGKTWFVLDTHRDQDTLCTCQEPGARSKSERVCAAMNLAARIDGNVPPESREARVAKIAANAGLSIEDLRELVKE